MLDLCPCVVNKLIYIFPLKQSPIKGHHDGYLLQIEYFDKVVKFEGNNMVLLWMEMYLLDLTFCSLHLEHFQNKVGSGFHKENKVSRKNDNNKSRIVGVDDDGFECIAKVCGNDSVDFKYLIFVVVFEEGDLVLLFFVDRKGFRGRAIINVLRFAFEFQFVKFL